MEKAMAHLPPHLMAMPLLVQYYLNNVRPGDLLYKSFTVEF